MTRVVVVGAGMVGTRFAADLTALDRQGRFDVTVLGAEPYEPYNRILLAEVVAGAVEVASLTLPDVTGENVALHRGTDVVAVNREHRRVRTAEGAVHGYDVLVLATGARARVPAVPGLDAGPDASLGTSLPAGVHALRTVDDCREVVAASVNARRAVVLGGGLLGIEAARGLSLRGLDVTVLHAAGHLLERQLDPEAAAVLQATAADLGIDVVTAAALTDVLLEEGRLRGLRLADGREIPTDLLVLAIGVVPATDLAAACGLSVGRGVVVGDDLRSPDDPHVAAIGDCAQPPEGGTGLVAEGWAQARLLAEDLTGTPGRRPAAAPDGGVVTLKADGLPVVTIGRPAADGDRAVRLSDLQGRRHVEVVVSDGRLVGATCVGAPDVAADLTAAFDRGTPLPPDPAHLLLRPVVGGAAPVPASPTLMPDRATVCRCNGVTKGDLVQAWSDGATTVDAVASCTRATTGCGGCTDAVCGLLEWLAEVDPPTSQPPTSQQLSGAGEHTVSGGKRQVTPAEMRAS
jgi:assimilatory nitrate reductase electron transfer subunit